MNKENSEFMLEAIRLSIANVEKGMGGPFGAVIVKEGKIIARGANAVTLTNDPTAHAEVVAIREACKTLNTFQLTGCEIYTSCEPCPMCMAAIYWARPDKVYYANSKTDAAKIGFDDDFIYQEINTDMTERKIPFLHFPHPLAKEVFKEWEILDNKKLY